MQYIRFLKTPRFKAIRAGHHGMVSALATISSDLGDAFMLRGSPILGFVRRPDGTIIARKEFFWAVGMRSIKIDIEVDPRDSGGGSVVLQISTSDLLVDQLASGPKTTILSVWSSPFYLNNNNVYFDGFSERRLDIGSGDYLGVWEETRDSIARHIWDGGIALTKYLAGVFSNAGSSSLGSLDERLRSNGYLNVLELGSGCGIVGLALAQLRTQCHVLMTDLPLAAGISSKNMERRKQVEFRVLDWDKDVPIDISEQHFDLLVVADCMYNPDAAPALVAVVMKLMENSPGAALVVSHKKRHENEDRFLHLLEVSGMVRMACTIVTIGEEDTDLVDGVDLYTMQISGG